MLLFKTTLRLVFIIQLVMVSTFANTKCINHLKSIISTSQETSESAKDFLNIFKENPINVLGHFSSFEEFLSKGNWNSSLEGRELKSSILDVFIKIKDNGESWDETDKIRYMADQLDVSMRTATVALFHSNLYFTAEKTLGVKNWLEYLYWMKNSMPNSLLVQMEIDKDLLEASNWINKYRGVLYKKYSDNLKNKMKLSFNQTQFNIDGINSVDGLVIEKKRSVFGQQYIIKGMNLFFPSEIESKKSSSSIMLYQLRSFLNELLSLKNIIVIDGQEVDTNIQLFVQTYDSSMDIYRELSLSEFSEKYMSEIFYEDKVSVMLPRFVGKVLNNLGPDFFNVHTPSTPNMKSIKNLKGKYNHRFVELDKSEDELKEEFLSELALGLKNQLSVEEIKAKIFTLDSSFFINRVRGTPVWLTEYFVQPLYKQSSHSPKTVVNSLPVLEDTTVPLFDTEEYAISAILSNRDIYYYKNKKKGAIVALESCYIGINNCKLINKKLEEIAKRLVLKNSRNKVLSSLSKLPHYSSDVLINGERPIQNIHREINSIVKEYNISVSLYNSSINQSATQQPLALVDHKQLYKYEVLHSAFTKIIENQSRLINSIKKNYPNIAINEDKLDDKNIARKVIKNKFSVVVDTDTILKYKGSVHKKDSAVYALVDIYTDLIVSGSIYHKGGVLKLFNKIVDLATQNKDLNLKYNRLMDEILFGQYDGQSATKKGGKISVQKQFQALKYLFDLKKELGLSDEAMTFKATDFSSYDEITNLLLSFPMIKTKVEESQSIKASILNEKKLRDVRFDIRAGKIEDDLLTFPGIDNHVKEILKNTEAGGHKALSKLLVSHKETVNITKKDSLKIFFNYTFQLIRKSFPDQKEIVDDYTELLTKLNLRPLDGKSLSTDIYRTPRSYDRVIHSLYLLSDLIQKVDNNTDISRGTIVTRGGIENVGKYINSLELNLK